MNRAVALALLGAGCSSSPNKTPDARKIVDAGVVAFQGEYVDWDSDSNIEIFCGIFQAEYTVEGSGSGELTPPNGRLLPTLPVGDDEISLTPPTTASPCANGSGVYENPGLIVVDPALAAGSGFTYSTRSFTTDRRTSMFTSLGLTYDPTKAQVFVNVQGTATNPTIDATFATTAAFSGSAWAPGSNGVYVFFPNVDPSVGHATLTATGYDGSADLPLTAGAFTYAAVSN